MIRKLLVGAFLLAFIFIMSAQFSWVQDVVAEDSPITSALSSSLQAVSSPITSALNQPVLTSINPLLGSVGNRFTLTGSNFTNNNSVFVGGAQIANQTLIISTNGTSLSFILDPNLTFVVGNQYGVYVSNSNSTSNSLNLKVTPAEVSGNNLSQLIDLGVFTFPTGNSSSAPSVTLATTTSISFNQNGGSGVVNLPKDTVITRPDGGNINANELQANAVDVNSLSGLTSGSVVKSALQWGVPNIGLNFSTPITITMPVSTELNGTILSVYRSTNTSSGWTTEGIVSPGNCTVGLGLCTFQASKASYFVAAQSAQQPTNSNPGFSAAGAPTCSDTKPGSAPSIISYQYYGNNELILKWIKAQDPVTYYLITYGLESGKPLYGNPNVGNVTEYTIKGLQPNVTYYFQVRAGNNCTPGEFSQEIAVKITGKVLVNKIAQGFKAKTTEAKPVAPKIITEPEKQPQSRVESLINQMINRLLSMLH